MSNLLYPTTVNAVSKQLNANYTAADAVITLTNTTSVQNKPGVCLINRVDTNGTLQPTANWTYIEFTATSGATLTGCTAISGDQDQALGKVVEFVSDVTQQQRILDFLLVNHSATGALKSGAQINDTSADHQYVLGVSELTADRTVTLPLLTAADEFVFQAHGLTTSANSNFTYHGLARQAIINGNFDVWQRGTSFTATGYTADRWGSVISGSSCTITRQAHTLGQTDVPNEPKYYIRSVVTTSAGAANRVLLYQPIESVRTFAGQNATISFYAKADAAKSIAIEFAQNFGTGGSPSDANYSITPQKVALTTSWAKYSVTIAVTSISGKTVGTTDDGFLSLNIWLDAGSNYDARTGTLGQQSGTFEFSEVQVNAGSVALPFQPKSYEEEKSACERYYEKSYTDSVALGTSTELGAIIFVDPVAAGIYPLRFRKAKRNASSTVTCYSTTGASGKYRDISSGADFDATPGQTGETGCRVLLATHGAADETVGFHYVAENEL